MRQISLRRERDRLLVAIAVAIIIHAAIFVLVPFSGLAEPDPLDPPMYVALDPLPPDPEEQVPEPKPEPEPVEEPDPEPEPESLLADDPELPAESAPEPGPAPEPEPEPAPEPESAPEPAAPPAESVPDEGAPAPGPAFVETPPPPPPPPRRRSTTDLRTFSGADRQTDSAVEDHLSDLYSWQSQYSEELEAWEQRQQERSSRTTTAESGDDPSADRDTAFLRNLSAMIEGIRTSSSNVVNSDDPARTTTGPSDQSSGDGSGIVVEDGSGTRRRTEGAPVDLTRVSLGAGFPPEYPVQVSFQVSAAGTVISARVQPPTPNPDLNRAIEAAVRQWRFESAADRQSSSVQGSVTIIVDTR